MPLIKPYITATASAPIASGGVVTTTVSPVISRYYAAVAGDMITTDTTIPVGDFVDDSDGPIAAFPVLTSAEYFNVYINGMLQQSGLSTLNTDSLVLDTTDISVGVPVMLEISSFSNAASAITTPQTISAPTITINT